MGMGIEFKKNIGELELGLQFLLNFSHEWELEWESPWFLDQLLISDFHQHMITNQYSYRKSNRKSNSCCELIKFISKYKFIKFLWYLSFFNIF